jgi:hypothetical protein
MTKKVEFDAPILAVGLRRKVRWSIKVGRNPFRCMKPMPITFIYKDVGKIIAISSKFKDKEGYVLVELEHPFRLDTEVALLRIEDVKEYTNESR